MAAFTTAALIGLSVFSAVSSIGAAEDQAEATVEQANLEAENKAKQVRLKAASQQVSFLNSGLTLDGTPLSAIQNTFDTGISDVNQITSNANTQAKNIISSARTDAIGSIAGSFAGASFGGGDIFGSAVDTAGFGLNSSGFGNAAYDLFDKVDGTT
tara:strand:- start:6495 stop:6962 length:468 start_codon:yes stop_codon:yes gene_type:complete